MRSTLRCWFVALGLALVMGPVGSAAAVPSMGRVTPSASMATRAEIRGPRAVPPRQTEVRRLVATATRRACRSSSRQCRLVSSARHRIGHGLIEDTFTLQVGAGRHALIRLHHITRSGRRPAPERAVFLVHGDVWGFDPVFAPRRTPGQSAGLARFLAHRRIDVWGIDHRWVQVPSSVTNTDFMHRWGFATEVSDMRVATTVTRSVRRATGARTPTMAMVGWSRGGQLAYAYAGRESQLPAPARNVDALVPADAVMRYADDDVAFRRGLCQSYRATRRAHNAGEDAVDFTGLAAIGKSALSDPDGDSGAGVTNRQLANAVGASVNGVFNSFFHFVAPTHLDSSGVPRGLQYTAERLWFRLLSHAAPKESLGNFLDGAAINCGTQGVPFALHLADVRVPVLYLAAAGGFGATGLHTLTLLGSKDITTSIVRLRPAGHERRDFGHVDLWTARRAPALAWGPLLAWLRRH